MIDSRFDVAARKDLQTASTRARALWAIGISAVMLAWLVPDLGRPGISWDEPEYFASVERIQTWTVELLKDPRAAAAPERIVAAFDPPEHAYFNPHPPVYKEGMALTEALFGGLLGPVPGYRLSSALLFALLVGTLVWVASGVGGLPTGVAAGVSVVLMPRVFGHAHFGATDLPLTAFWVGSALAFYSYLRSGRRRSLALAAIALGLAMGTKFTGWLLPVPLLVWAVLERRWWKWFAVVPCALVVWYLFVPPAWNDPLGAVARLFTESLSRELTAPMTTFYLGTMFPYVVPWHQSIVMLLVTVPLGILVLSLVGICDAARSRKIMRPADPRAALARLCLLHVGFFLAVMALPGSPNHDGVRLFLPSFPFVAILAGLGFGRLMDLAQRWLHGPASILVGLVVASVYFLPAWWQTERVSPYYLSYYNELIGGLRGAERSGMELSYWYDAMTPEFLARVEQTLPEGSTVLTWPTWKYFEELQAMGRLSPGINLSREWPAPYLLLLARKSTLFPPFLDVYENVQPVLAVELDGVELAGLYAWSTAPDSIVPEPEGDEE